MSQYKVPEKQVDILNDWKSKGRSNLSLNTYERMFTPAQFNAISQEKPIRLERTLRLREEETKGKQYNIINGLAQTHEQWIGAYGASKSPSPAGRLNQTKDHWQQLP